MKKISVDEFRMLVSKIFEKYGFSEEEIEICTDEIVEAQCRGRLSHGATLIPEILEWKKEIKGPMEIVKNEGVYAYIKGNNSMGPVVAVKAMDIAIEKAEKFGLGIVGVVNRFPFILAGYNPRRAARKGYIGINWSVAFSKVAIHCSADRLIGTNPLGIGIPYKEFPIVLDMAITKIPAADIRRAKRLGERIPEEVALSPEGKFTTDPEEALKGAMVTFGGYKGSGLGIIIELLGGAFVGAKVGKNVPGDRGMVFMAIKPDLFVPKEKFLHDIEMFVKEVKSSRKLKNCDEILLPGERSEKLYKKCLEEGIELEDKVYQMLMDLLNKGGEK